MALAERLLLLSLSESQLSFSGDGSTSVSDFFDALELIFAKARVREDGRKLEVLAYCLEDAAARHVTTLGDEVTGDYATLKANLIGQFPDGVSRKVQLELELQRLHIERGDLNRFLLRFEDIFRRMGVRGDSEEPYVVRLLAMIPREAGMFALQKTHTTMAQVITSLR